MQISTRPKDGIQQLNLAQNVLDAVDPADMQICLILLQYNVDECESLNDQVLCLREKSKHKKNQHNVFVV